jgi:hypothetical protein
MNRQVLLRAAGAGPDEPPPRVEDPIERFWRWVEVDAPPGEGLELLLHHLKTFWDRRSAPNVVLVHYADLQADLEGEMRRLATRLGIAVADDVWPHLVADAGFDRMRARADTLVPQVTTAGLWPDAGRFFNRGTSGQWRGLLRPEDLDRYWTRVHRLAPPDLVAWVHGGWPPAIRDPARLPPRPVARPSGSAPEPGRRA